jgi:hypothetical protein
VARSTHERMRLCGDFRRVARYARRHSGEWVGFGIGANNVDRLVAAFTDHVDDHRRALLSLVEHPEFLTVKQRAYPEVLLAWVRDELWALEPGPTLMHGVSNRYGRVGVHLTPWAEGLAEQLHERYGDVVELFLGALPYPPRPIDRQPHPEHRKWRVRHTVSPALRALGERP